VALPDAFEVVVVQESSGRPWWRAELAAVPMTPWAVPVEVTDDDVSAGAGDAGEFGDRGVRVVGELADGHGEGDVEAGVGKRDVLDVGDDDVGLESVRARSNAARSVSTAVTLAPSASRRAAKRPVPRPASKPSSPSSGGVLSMSNSCSTLLAYAPRGVRTRCRRREHRRPSAPERRRWA
jgi:hypothetical protein